MSSTTDQRAEDLARQALDRAGALAGGWRLIELQRRAPDLVVVVLAPPATEPSAPGLALEWSVHEVGADRPEGSDVAATPELPERPAFRQGATYAASYRRGPGVWDVDADGTPEHARRRAAAACEALAALAGGAGLYANPSDAAAPKDPSDGALPDAGEDDTAALARALDAAIRDELGGAALANPEGWAVEEVRTFARWERVAEVFLSAPDGRQLVFIVSPGDGRHPAFRRTPRFDLVYYSEDLPVARHGELYARDRASIERFARWLDGFDRRGGAPAVVPRHTGGR